MRHVYPAASHSVTAALLSAGCRPLLKVPKAEARLGKAFHCSPQRAARYWCRYKRGWSGRVLATSGFAAKISHCLHDA